MASTQKSTSKATGVSKPKSNTSSGSGGKSKLLSGSRSTDAAAQGAVDRGYVKSVQEYRNAEASGNAGANFGYTNKGSASKPNYVANTSSRPPVDPTEPVDAGMVTDMQSGDIPFKPDTGAPMTDYNAFVNSAAETQQYQTQYDQEVAQRELEIQKMQQKRTDLADTFNLPQEYKSLQKEYGVKDLTKQLQQANLQLTQMQSQYQMTNQELAQQTVPEAFVIGQQNELAKTAAIKIGAQASYVQALQGNLDLANHYVDQMIDLKERDFTTKYNAQTDNINLAMQFLGQSYSKQAQMVQQKLDLEKADYSQMLDTQKASWQNALLNGADSATIQAIANAKTTQDVISAAGKYAVDPMAQAQLRTEQLQQQKLLQDINAADAPNISDQVNSIFQNQDANTPVIAKTVLSELLGSKAISVGTRGRIAPAVEVLNSLDEFANANQEGKFIGSGGFLGFSKLKEGIKGIFNMKNPEAISNKQQIDAVNLKVQQWASGASLTADQTKKVNAMTPTTWDSDKEIMTKTSQLYNFMLNQAEGNLLTEGVNVQFPQVDLFEIQKLYKKASPEQKKIIEETYFNK